MSSPMVTVDPLGGGGASAHSSGHSRMGDCNHGATHRVGQSIADCGVSFDFFNDDGAEPIGVFANAGLRLLCPRRIPAVLAMNIPARACSQEEIFNVSQSIQPNSLGG